MDTDATCGPDDVAIPIAVENSVAAEASTEVSSIEIPSIEVPGLKEAMAAISINTEKFNSFHPFPRLPAELRLKIIAMAALTPRYIPMSLQWEHPDNDEYERKMPHHVRYRADITRAATYRPDRNYNALIRTNKEFRGEILETLKPYDYVSNNVTAFGQFSNVFLNWESDVMVLDYADRESQLIQRIVVPMPQRYTELKYMHDLRMALPNLRELYFLNGGRSGLDDKTHPCTFLPNMVRGTRVLVDISESEEDDPWYSSRAKFKELREELEGDKVKIPDWKLRKVGLVVWASDDGVHGCDVGRVADDGTGIFHSIPAAQKVEEATVESESMEGTE